MNILSIHRESLNKTLNSRNCVEQASGFWAWCQALAIIIDIAESMRVIRTVASLVYKYYSGQSLCELDNGCCYSSGQYNRYDTHTIYTYTRPTYSPDVLKLVSLLTLPSLYIDIITTFNCKIMRNDSPIFCLPTNLTKVSFFSEKEIQFSNATIGYNKYEVKFVSAIVIKLTRRHLSKDEISLLSKRLIFDFDPKQLRQ